MSQEVGFVKQAIQDILTKNVITVGASDSVRTAYQIMKDKNIRHLPVIDEHGDMVGILSDKDIFRAITPIPINSGREVSIEIDSTLRVKDFMSWPVRTVTDDSYIGDVANIFTAEKISAVVIIGKNNKYRGIVTSEDLISHLSLLLKEAVDHSKAKINLLLVKTS